MYVISSQFPIDWSKLMEKVCISRIDCHEREENSTTSKQVPKKIESFYVHFDSLIGSFDVEILHHTSQRASVWREVERQYWLYSAESSLPLYSCVLVPIESRRYPQSVCGVLLSWPWWCACVWVFADWSCKFEAILKWRQSNDLLFAYNNNKLIFRI